MYRKAVCLVEEFVRSLLLYRASREPSLSQEAAAAADKQRKKQRRD